jgi:hypothetical protein
MHHSLYLLIPFALAATRGLAIGIVPPDLQRAAMPAETEYRILLGVAATLTLLLVVASVMTTHPEIGALVAEYNRF